MVFICDLKFVILGLSGSDNAKLFMIRWSERGNNTSVKVIVHLYPPLNNAAGKSRVDIALGDKNTVAGVIDKLADEFGPKFRSLLFDDRGLIIPGWCARINQDPPLHFNQVDTLATMISDGDEISILLALAGG